VQRADDLFKEAKALLDGGRIGEACPKFAESNRLAPAIGVSLYLADCYERAGLTVRAWRQFKEAAALAAKKKDQRAPIAEQRASRLEAQLSKLTIAVPAAARVPDLAVTLDATPVPPEEWGVAVPTDPGQHVLVATAPGHRTRQTAVNVPRDQGSTTIVVEPLEQDRSVAAAGAGPSGAGGAAGAGRASAPTGAGGVGNVEDAGGARPANAGNTQRVIGIGIGGAGVVITAVGFVFGAMAKSKLDESNDGHCDSSNTCDDTGLGLRSDADASATRANIAIGVGVVAIAAGIVLFVTAPHGDKTAQSRPVAARSPLTIRF
jgi:hypothetical protein